MPINVLARLPHHTPQREARIRGTEKVLHALMLEAQLVKELLVVSPTQHQRRQRDDERWCDHLESNQEGVDRIPNSSFFYDFFWRGGVFRMTLWEGRRVAGNACSTGGMAGGDGKQRVVGRRTSVRSQGDRVEAGAGVQGASRKSFRTAP